MDCNVKLSFLVLQKYKFIASNYFVDLIDMCLFTNNCSVCDKNVIPLFLAECVSSQT